jgi:lipoate---protein ligase
MSAYLISKISDPYTNLALGSYITKLVKNKQLNYSKIMFLSTSHHGVFIGQSQNCWAEANIKLMDKENVPLIRRDTGGGACYVDRGNRLFGFISKDEPKIGYPVVIDALHNLGLPAELKGRNDIVVNDKKISGSAFSQDGDIHRHHGTILHNVDKTKLTKYLTPSKIKLKSKGIKSIITRINNLVDFDANISMNDVDSAMIAAFGPAERLSMIDLISIDRKAYDSIYDMFLDKAYTYNKNPEFTRRIEQKFSFGLVECCLECVDNKIIRCDIFSDALDLRIINNLKLTLMNENYNLGLLDRIKEKLLKMDQGDDYEQMVNEFCHNVDL